MVFLDCAHLKNTGNEKSRLFMTGQGYLLGLGGSASKGAYNTAYNTVYNTAYTDSEGIFP